MCGDDQGVVHLQGRACVVLEMGIGDADGEGGEGERAAGGTSRPVMECRQQKCFGEERRRLADYYSAGTLERQGAHIGPDRNTLISHTTSSVARSSPAAVDPRWDAACLQPTMSTPMEVDPPAPAAAAPKASASKDKPRFEVKKVRTLLARNLGSAH